jgi:hypothetical protein
MGRTRRHNQTSTAEAELQNLVSQTSSPALSPRGQDPTSRDLIGELVERLAGLGTSKPKFKPPKFSGDTDVELFINQFLDVADASKWSERESVLHLRSNLEGPAISCGQGTDLEEIFGDLRSRFGITPRQARIQLGQLQKKHKQTFHELGAEVVKLVRLAYPRQGQAFHNETALETFHRAVNNKSLQHHLLARPHESIAEAIIICNEFTQVESGRTTIATIDTPEPKRDNSTTVQDMLTTLQELVTSHTKVLNELVQKPPVTRKLECFECGGPHLKRNCPNLKSQAPQQSGNANSPAQ